jgi:hypothetical protein
MAYDSHDPDASLIVTFRNGSVPNPAKSKLAGRPIHDDVEYCDIRFPGRRDWQPFPATAFAGWRTDPFSGEQVSYTYAERFSKQYRQFKEHVAQTKAGTPLAEAPFLTEARRAELRAQNIYVVEQLAAIDGQELKNLGHGGRDMKNQALEYIEASKGNAPDMQLKERLEAAEIKNRLLEEDLASARKAAPPASNGSGEFADMTDDQLRDFIRVHSGHTPQGNLNRKVLERMAMDHRPSKVA